MCNGYKCPAKNQEVNNELCELFTPYGGSRCTNLYKRWIKTEKEVIELEKVDE